MSTARHHTEWLSLIEVSGPFLSLPVLLEAFPLGLDTLDRETRNLLLQAHEEWQDNQGGVRPDTALHRVWIKFVLQKALGYDEQGLREGQAIPYSLFAELPVHGETLIPDLALVNPEGTPDAGAARLLVQIVPAGQDLEKPLAGKHRWKASPATRMAELLHATNVRLGLVTNGECWMLINAPRGETTGYVSWLADLWSEEPVTLRAFVSLLRLGRFFAEEPTLESMLAKSADNQQDVTNQLGLQVRKAVEVLVQSLDRLDIDSNRALLADAAPSEVYSAALTIMMRLVFLFSAEERGLLLLGDPLYDQHYAVSTLRAQLREQADRHGEEVLERRSDAWSRLLATFRAVHAGVRHDELTLSAHGGTLFDPDRFPFLEGRALGTRWQELPARPLQVNNRTVLHLLEALQFLQVKVPGGPPESRRLSFRALDIEQIGHVYESLLDHTARRTGEVVLGLAGSKEPEVPLAKLETLRGRGEAALLEFLEEEAGRSQKALIKALGSVPEQSERFLTACGNDSGLWERVQPFAGLVRQDTLGYPVVIAAGSLYVTEGSDRRSTGTHYTPRSLTEPIVEHTLKSSVYEGPAEGWPQAKWRLRGPAELLDLKVCDMAMGSGAFLVQACRYLAERLVEAWEAIEKDNPGRVVITPEGKLSTGAPDEQPLPEDLSERLAMARRFVADRCLYGVDKNPTAVEMAKLSLWLITLQKNRPFTFLDHALRCGDSLLGLTQLRQLECLNLNPLEEQERPVLAAFITPLLEEAIQVRQELEGFTVADIRDVERKKLLLDRADNRLELLRLVGDLLVGCTLKDRDPAEFSEPLVSVLGKGADYDELQEKATAMLGNRKPFHWVLEFPEVFLTGRRGFDALVGNPPIQGGKKITGALGTDYRNFLVKQIARGKRGHADLCTYFFLQGQHIIGLKGMFGLIATKTIAQGDTREVGLDQLVQSGFIIPRAVPSRKWPGAANLEVAHVWVAKEKWQGEYVLDDKVVPSITPFLSPPGKVLGNPYKLKANQGKSFVGSYVLGMGFVLMPEEAQALIRKDPRNEDVLFPYLNGEDLNSRPDQSPSRWVINFKDWPLDAEHDDPKKPKGPPYAADYPDCLAIIEEKVKPERTRKNEKGVFVLRKPLPQRWWIYADKRPELYATITRMEKVLIFAQTSKTKYPMFANNNCVFDQKTVVIASDNYSDFSILCSHIHYFWVLHKGSSLRVDPVYTPSDCFETFPFPPLESHTTNLLEVIGERYYSHRQFTTVAYREGLTKIYNRFHSSSETAVDIKKLRNMHVDMDQEVSNAYDWTDLDLGHDFHETKQGVRFTISESARREVLDRLLALNHQRYQEEQAQLPYEQAQKKARGKKQSVNPDQASLL